MKVTKTQRFMLYTLGKWLEEAGKKVKKPLTISISKSIFIDAVKKSGIAKKHQRSLYKNLEILEKKKLITYKHKELKLTSKGKRLYAEIDKQIKPYIFVHTRLGEKGPIKYTRKIQAVFE
jgi:hypothetical protein